MANPELLNMGELAAELRRSRFYVQAMKRSGFQCSHGSRTTVKAALAWLAAHPDFRTTGAFPRGVSKRANRTPSRLSSSGGKPGERS